MWTKLLWWRCHLVFIQAAAVMGRFWGLKVTLSPIIMEWSSWDLWLSSPKIIVSSILGFSHNHGSGKTTPKWKETPVGGTHFSTEPWFWGWKNSQIRKNFEIRHLGFWFHFFGIHNWCVWIDPHHLGLLTLETFAQRCLNTEGPQIFLILRHQWWRRLNFPDFFPEFWGWRVRRLPVLP